MNKKIVFINFLIGLILVSLCLSSLSGCFNFPHFNSSSDASSSSFSNSKIEIENSNRYSEWSNHSDLSFEYSSLDQSSAITSENSSESSSPDDLKPESTYEHFRKYYVSVPNANLRKEPTTKSKVIRSLQIGTQFEYISGEDDWIYGAFAGEIFGYIHSSLVTGVPSLYVWPKKYSIEKFYDAKIEKYLGNYSGDGYFPLKGITVIINPEHGGTDVGSIFKKSIDGRVEVLEKDINLEIAKKTEQELIKLGAKVVMTRTNDEYTSLYKRCGIVNLFLLDSINSIITKTKKENFLPDTLKESFETVITTNSDDDKVNARGIMKGLGVNEDFRLLLDACAQMKDVILISINMSDANQDSDIRGIEMHYGTNKKIHESQNLWLLDFPEINPINPSYSMYDEGDRKRLALILKDNILENSELQVNGDGLYESSDCLLRNINLTSVKINLGYLSQTDDRDFLTERTGQKRLALSIAKGIFEYFCTDIYKD